MVDWEGGAEPAAGTWSCPQRMGREDDVATTVLDDVMDQSLAVPGQRIFVAH